MATPPTWHSNWDIHIRGYCLLRAWVLHLDNVWAQRNLANRPREQGSNPKKVSSICHCQSGTNITLRCSEKNTCESRTYQKNLDLSVSICGLNTSLPSCVHPKPINPVFYRCSITKSLFKRSFKLRCFQFLSRAT